MKPTAGVGPVALILSISRVNNSLMRPDCFWVPLVASKLRLCHMDEPMGVPNTNSNIFIETKKAKARFATR